jgi:DNA-binding NarL/FixJ family response regulator
MMTEPKFSFSPVVEPLLSAAGATTRQAGVAACLLDAMEDDQIALAMGLDVFTVRAIVRRLHVRTGTTNAGGLALALNRLAVESHQ